MHNSSQVNFKELGKTGEKNSILLSKDLGFFILFFKGKFRTKIDF